MLAYCKLNPVIKMQKFSCKAINWKMSCTQWSQCCLGSFTGVGQRYHFPGARDATPSNMDKVHCKVDKTTSTLKCRCCAYDNGYNLIHYISEHTYDHDECGKSWAAVASSFGNSWNLSKTYMVASLLVLTTAGSCDGHVTTNVLGLAFLK